MAAIVYGWNEHVVKAEEVVQAQLAINKSWLPDDVLNIIKDFLYISALSQSKFVLEIKNYEAFSDFAYSTRIGKAKKGKSWNCQARSVAIFKGLFSTYNRSELLKLLSEYALDSSREMKDGPLTLF